MGFIEYHQGCGEINNVAQGICWGPHDNYYTIFGSELRHLVGHVIFSVFVGLVLLGILAHLKKKGKIKLPRWSLILISTITTIILFFLLAALVPVRVMY